MIDATTPAAVEARNATLLRVRPIVRYHVRRLCPHNRADADDLRQEAYLAFLLRWDAYDGEHGSLFARWMTSYGLRRLNGRKRLPTEPLVGEPIGRAEPVGPLAAAEEEAERRAQAQAVRAAVARLPDPRRRLVVVALFGLDGSPPRTLQEIGAEFGVTKERVRQIKDAALAQLGRLLVTPAPTTPAEE